MKQSGNVAISLSWRLPPKECRAPGETAAHGFEQHQIALLYAAVGRRDRQGQRYGRRRRVAVEVDRHHYFLRSNMQLVRRSVDDSPVSLVGDEPIDVVGASARGVERVHD